MPLTTSIITGRAPTPDDTVAQYSELIFTLSSFDTEGEAVVLPGAKRAIINADGTLPSGFELWRNTEGLRGTLYLVSARWIDPDRYQTTQRFADLGRIQVGDDATYDLTVLLNAIPPDVPEGYWLLLTPEQLQDIEDMVALAATITPVGEAVLTAADEEAARLALEITAPPAAINQLEYDFTFSGTSFNYGPINGIVVGSDGMVQLVVGPYTLQIGFGDYMRPPGIIQDGAITNVTKSGEYWQYRADGVQYIVHDTYPNYTPGLLDTTVIDIALRNGQSWNTQIRLPVDLNLEDPTGYTRKRLDNYRTAEFVVPRAELDFSPRIPWDNRAIKRLAYSNDGALSGAAGSVTGLRLWEPGVSRTYDGGSEVDFFTIGDITSLSRQHFLRELRLPRVALVSAQFGRAGTEEKYFLADGTSFAGSGGTVTAEILTGNSNYFFTNDTNRLAEIAAIIEADWFDKPVTYSVETFDQGGAGTTQTADDDHFFNFLTARRSDVNSRALPCLDGTTVPWLIVPIGFAASKETDQGYQAVDQCRWSDVNAGGKDLAVGPFYHLKLLQESVPQSAIHGTAMHNLRKGEMMGLVEACVISPAWGRVDRFKISGVNHYPGSNKLTLTVNSPILASGLPLIDTTEVAARTQYGFTVKRGTDGTDVPVTVTVVDQSYIDVTYTAGALVGETEVLLDYAGFGVAQADAALNGATQSACQGNIKKAGRFIGPISLQPIDFWLSPYRENITL